MILQALTRYYEDLLVRGEISVPGWSPENISYALRLDADGQLAGIIPTMKEQEQGKKNSLAASEYETAFSGQTIFRNGVQLSLG